MKEFSSVTTLSNTRVIINKITLFFLAVNTIFIVLYLLWLCRHGFEFTDESFYLIWVSSPFNYDVSLTQFGFIYHPLYLLFDGSIALLRQANVLITFGLAWTLSNILLTRVLAGGFSIASLIITSALASSALIFFKSWIPAPSYNSLTFQSLLIVSIGFILASPKINRESIVGWLLIGVGGWLAFMAKMSTAACLSVFLSVALLAAGKFNVKLCVLAAITALSLVLLSALAIDGSFSLFLKRIEDAVELARLLGGGHTFLQFFRLDEFQLSWQNKRVLYASIAIIYLLGSLYQTDNPFAAYFSQFAFLAGIVFGFAVMFNLIDFSFHVDSFEALLVFAIPYATILIGFSAYRFAGLVSISSHQWVLFVYFLALPYVYAFGTNNNYYFSEPHVGFFWIISGLIFLAPLLNASKVLTALIPIGIAAQIFTIVLLNPGIQNPYRQSESLVKNNVRTLIGERKSELILSGGFSQYLTGAITLVGHNGFEKGTPVVDLSGQSPGLLYAIGAKSVAQAWMIGGYPGSNTIAEKMLARASCEDLAVAWILVEPQGPRKLSEELLKKFGANLVADYQSIGSLNAPAGAGGYSEIRQQLIFRPVRPKNLAIDACNTTRSHL